MTMVVSVLTLLLCCSSVIVVQCESPLHDPDPVRCYTCRREGDNEECNKEITQCTAGQFCRTDVSYWNNVMKLNKSCGRTCETTDQTFCNVAATKCGYCCNTDLCNEGVTSLIYNTDNVTIKDDLCSPQPGPQGEPGPMGPIGSPGHPGMDGRPGRDGAPGYDGMSGSKGGAGFPGVDGRLGARGAVGPSGLPGLNGLPGQDGAKGPKGDQGMPGYYGSPGRDGAPGSTGDKGDRGDNGLKGGCACPDPQPEVSKPEVVAFFGRVSGVSQASTDHVTLMIDTSVNLGHAYNATTSVFTAPHRAAYLFSVNVICDGNKAVPLQLFKNEESVASSGRREDDQIGTGTFYPVGIIQVILTLEVGDEVTLRITPRGEGYWDQFKSFMASHSDVTYSGHMVGFA